MPRMARVVMPGEPHHVTQRGNRGQKVFFRKADRRRYLSLLAEYSAKHGLSIQAYCLMTNHVHVIVVPPDAGSLAATLKPVHLRYAQEINRRLDVTGVFWQGRFFSCPLDAKHFWAAVRYVEANPVRAGIVERAEDYPWSSAAARCGLRGDVGLAELPSEAGPARDWSTWLAGREDTELVERVRLSTRTGRPAGSGEFIDRLQRFLGRTLRPKKGGRPRKGQGQKHG